MDLTPVRTVYDAAAPTYDVLLPDLRIEQPVDRTMIRAFCDEVLDTSDHTVLDAGCGAGRMIPELKDRGLRPRGVDLSSGMIERARRREPEVDFRVADLRALPYADDSFGGVIAWYSLIHFDYPALAEALTELARVTKPGGVLLTGFQVGSGLREISNAYGTRSEMTAWLYSPEEIGSVATAAGWTTTATARREPVMEPHPQGFVLARKGE
ncbi:methyltransferase domain-containing protein [Kocuria sp. JC486]|uniref:class I SAM-dependent DNA methyltransferase n=1 Tax=Kocuria sp. JC486 TaxID=1970736 RepID=UPI00142104B7|nr:class I SAM-dependent methyltransferase [Kocuria sp. JC486]NHU85708.1 methyltransferase domain-containing protein [Kocuria sp. JC486]